VTKSHIEEAYRLLNKSIIRVEKPDICFESDEEHVEPDDDDILSPPDPEKDKRAKTPDDSMDIMDVQVTSPYSIHSASSPGKEKMLR